MSKNVKKSRYDVSYEEYKQFVQTLGISTVVEFNQKKSNFPKIYPRSPASYFKKNKTWKYWGDFLGTEKQYRKKFRTYSEGQKFCQENGINNQKDYEELSESGKRPIDMPSSPRYTYKNNGWQGWGNFTGSGNIANQNIQFCSYKKTEKFAQYHEIKSQTYWKKFVKTNKLPSDIPRNPDHVYKNNGWTTWGDFLGTGYIAFAKRNYPPIKDAKIEARKIAKELGINSVVKWNIAWDEGKIPKYLPRDLHSKYSRTGSIEEQRKKWRKKSENKRRSKQFKEKKK